MVFLAFYNKMPYFRTFESPLFCEPYFNFILQLIIINESIFKQILQKS